LSMRYIARCIVLYIKRGFTEDKRSTVFSIALSIVLTIVVVANMAREISAIPPQGVAYVGNLYVLTLGATIGFLASVTTSSTASVYHQDRVSHFIEVILSTPLTPKTYIDSITIASIINSIISYTAIALVYTAVSTSIASTTARQILLNHWIYIVALLMTILTSLLSIAMNIIATRLSIDPSRLAILPSTAIFLTAILIPNILGIKTLANEHLYTFITTLGAACSALIIAIEIMAQKLAGEYLITW